MELKSIYVQDQRGNVLPGATAFLYLSGTTTLASGLVGSNGLPITNPFNADVNGRLQFAAPSGRYDLRVVSSNQDYTTPIQFVDPGNFITPDQYGAVGNGIVNDTSSFSALEAAHSGKEVDLLGRTYVVDAIPNANAYYNGQFKVGASVFTSMWRRMRDENGIIAARGSAELIPPSYVMPLNQFGYNNAVVTFGTGALSKASRAKQTVAIGPDVMGNTTMSFDNYGVGECALQNVQSDTDDYSTTLTRGTRNVAWGGNSLQNLVTGRNNLAGGRNSGTCLTSCVDAVVLGANALAGEVYSGWFPYVENFVPNDTVDAEIAIVGAGVGHTYAGPSLTSIGYRAGFNLKIGDSNLLMGNRAGMELESLVGWGGKVRSDYPSDPYVTYVKTGSDVVVNAPGHGAVVGGKAHIYWAVGGPCYANHGHPFPVTVTAVAGDTFTVQCPYVPNGSGNARLYWTTSLVDAVKSRHNVINGPYAASKTTQAAQCLIQGSLAAQNVTGDMSSAVIQGYGACQNVVGTPTAIVVTGTNAMRDNTANIGSASAYGHNAGLLLQSGVTPNISVVNSTMLGSNSRVSGANQVQLGDSSTTTYVYGTVQNRSDERDKADIRDTVLGLDFICALRPVDYKWDMRDDYIVVSEIEGQDDEGNATITPVVTHLERDGSKTRNRYHHGFIAQEVAQLIESTGIDFGGYQDHLLEGGCDVKTIGYDEVIGPMVKAIQQLTERVKALEAASTLH